jgi:short-subunit dehydrogenase
MKIQGSGVVVTGASQGLGASLAKELAARGARVVLVARRRGALDALAKEIRARGGDAHALVADVADKTATHAIAGAAAALVGDVDLLVHNASALGPTPLRLLLDTECEDTKAIVGGMLLRDRGLVVQVSSDAATSAYPRWGAYGASKAAGDHLTRIWAAELEGTGVRFLSVDPGEMDTKMHADALPDADPSTLARPDDVAQRLVALIERSDLERSGARIELASAEAV